MLTMLQRCLANDLDGISLLLLRLIPNEKNSIELEARRNLRCELVKDFLLEGLNWFFLQSFEGICRDQVGVDFKHKLLMLCQCGFVHDFRQFENNIFGMLSNDNLSFVSRSVADSLS